MSVFILGVDPGLANFGYASVRLDGEGETVLCLGVLSTRKSDKKRKVLASDDNVRRIREIVPAVKTALGGNVPQIICAESMSFPRNSSASAKVGMMWGFIATFAEELRVPVVQASPQEVKKAVCGSKSASKKDVEDALLIRYSECEALRSFKKNYPKTFHEHGFDALAAVVACLDSEVLRLARGFSS